MYVIIDHFCSSSSNIKNLITHSFIDILMNERLFKKSDKNSVNIRYL